MADSKPKGEMAGKRFTKGFRHAHTGQAAFRKRAVLGYESFVGFLRLPPMAISIEKEPQ